MIGASRVKLKRKSNHEFIQWLYLHKIRSCNFPFSMIMEFKKIDGHTSAFILATVVLSAALTSLISNSFAAK